MNTQTANAKIKRLVDVLKQIDTLADVDLSIDVDYSPMSQQILDKIHNLVIDVLDDDKLDC